MPHALSTYVLRMLREGPAPLADLTVPVLVWDDGPPPPNEELIFATHAGGVPRNPSPGEPLVFELRKLEGKINPFAMGVTVGRNDNNDVVLEHPSISRFHAYFQYESRNRRWRLVDAESRNGTWCGALKLQPSVAEPVADQSRLKFGDLKLTFMEPDAFRAYLRRMSAT